MPIPIFYSQIKSIANYHSFFNLRLRVGGGEDECGGSLSATRRTHLLVHLANCEVVR